MLIDVAAALLLVLAIFRGYTKGFIYSVLSVVGFVVALAAALKLSSVVAEKLATGLGESYKWLPLLSFILVMVVMMLLVRLVARLLQKSFEFAMLGWANRLLGVVLFALLYASALSFLLFFGRQMHIITDADAALSKTYPFIAPLAPMIINGFGVVMPWFKTAFEQLKQFFAGVASKTA